MNHSPDDHLYEDVNNYVFNIFKDNLSPDFVYHNYQHTIETVDACKKLSKDLKLPEDDYEMLLLAAWFHDTGYIYNYKNHEEESVKIARDFLQKSNYAPDKISRIEELILATKREKKPEDLLSQILLDADLIKIGQKGFFNKSDLLRAEWANLDIVECDDLEWNRSQLDFLTNVHFHTQVAQELYGEQLLSNIQEQRQKLNKLEKKQDKQIVERERIKAQPKRGIETMFRSVYRNHINLSSIADNKANMMISINSLIISITLTIVGAKFSIFGTSFSEDQKVIFPIISLLLTSLFAIIFAILSAKPKVTANRPPLDKLHQSKSSVLFFGNFTNISLEEFETEMVSIMKSEDKLYGNMITDLYYLGKVLTKKYRLLSLSYLTFMIGLIVTVLIAIFVVVYLRQTD